MRVSMTAKRIGGAAIAAVLAAGTLVAQKNAAGGITEASVRAHMGFLASDALQGRGSGSRDEWLAAVYIAAQMRRWGIEPLGDDGDYVQQVDTPRAETVAPPVLTVGDSRFMHGGGMLVQSLDKTDVTGPLVRYRKGSAAPAGSVVLVPDGATPDDADVKDAAMLLSVATTQQRQNWAQTASRLLTMPRVLPGAAPARGGASGRGGGPAAQAMTHIALSTDAYATFFQLPDQTSVTFKADMRPSHTWNAIGEIKGSDPARSNEVILLTAHLDHLGVAGVGACRAVNGDTICNGADDDASGTTAVLELAEALSKGPKPKRTVMFAWFGSEETGGAGARNFLEHPPVPLDHIVANLEFEMIGRADDMVPPHTLWLTGYPYSNLGPELAKQGAKIVADPHPDQCFFQRSDNIQLARAGVVAQTVSSFGLHKDYHQPSDELKTIDFPRMTDAIQSMYAPVVYLLTSTFKPQWNKDIVPPNFPACGRGRGGH